MPNEDDRMKAFRDAAARLHCTDEEVDALISELQPDPSPLQDAPPERFVSEYTEEELAERDHQYRVSRFWQRWKEAQMKRCHTMRFRHMVVEYLDQKITGNETALPYGVADHIDTIVQLDAGEKPDTAPEMHPYYAPTLYREIQDKIRRKQRRRRGGRS